MPIRDIMRRWLGPKSEPAPDRLYSPAERGTPDPEPPDFNIGDRVRAAGDAQAGAIAQFDARRRRFSGDPPVIPDGTVGMVRGVDRDMLFVEIPGDNGLLAQFLKADWFNITRPEQRHWGTIRVTAAAGRDRRQQRHPSERRKRIYMPTYYRQAGDSTGVAWGADVADMRDAVEVTLKPGARVLDISNDELRKTASTDANAELMQAVLDMASAVKDLSATVAAMQSRNTGGYDAVRTEDRLIVLNDAAVAEKPKQRNRWMQASRSLQAEDAPPKAALTWRGLPVYLEHTVGDIRGADTEYPAYMGYHYGYIPDTEAVDGDAVDVILGADADSDTVYLGVQRDPDDGSFSQFKVMLDFSDAASAEAAMHLMWTDSMIGDVIEVPADEFIDIVLPKLDVHVDTDLRITAGGLSSIGPRKLKRLMRGDVEFAMISAARGQSKRKDKVSTSALRRDIAAMGYPDGSIKSTQGEWEGRTEPSLLVIGMTLEDAKALGTKYDQDAIIHKGADGVPAMYDLKGDGGATVPSEGDKPLSGEDAVSIGGPDDLYTKTRSTSFEFKYDWDDPMTVAGTLRVRRAAQVENAREYDMSREYFVPGREVLAGTTLPLKSVNLTDDAPLDEDSYYWYAKR